MRIAIIGQGYVGETAAVSFAMAGHRVTGIEAQSDRLAILQSGQAGVVEPGLSEAIAEQMAAGRLDFVQNEAQLGNEQLDAVLISVGTPPHPEGGANLDYVRQAFRQVLAIQPQPKAVVVTSTIPPGTSDQLLAEFEAIDPTLRKRFAHNPVFFSQGNAIDEWRNPHRLIFGTHNPELEPLLSELYRGYRPETPVMIMRPASAEFVKYGSNNALAIAISAINQMTPAIDKRGALIDEVVEGMGHDPRILRAILPPGLGFGDSCLIKDLLAMSESAREIGEVLQLVDAAYSVNAHQRQIPVDFALSQFGIDLALKKIAVIGLSNERLSDDMRKAPSISIVNQLTQYAGEVATWDPLLPSGQQDELFPDAVQYTSIADAVRDADMALILTEYDEVVEADWETLAATMNGDRIVIDGRNCLPLRLLQSTGLTYYGFGRPLTDDSGKTIRSLSTGAVTEGNPYFGHATDMYKHLLLVNVLAIESPTHVAETHAGSATYRLPTADTDPGRDYGVRHFLATSGSDPQLAVSRFRQQLMDGSPDEYPGSAALAMRELGTGTTYTFCEIGSSSRANLRSEAARLGLNDQVRIVGTDGLSEIWSRAANVADPSQVLVHIDPFEPKDAPKGISSPQLAAKLGDLGFKVVFWYPFADPADRGAMEPQIKTAMAGSTDKVWVGEIATAAEGARFPVSPITGKGSLAGCGIVAINMSPEAVNAMHTLGQALVTSYDGRRLPDGTNGSLEFTTSVTPSMYCRANTPSVANTEGLD